MSSSLRIHTEARVVRVKLSNSDAYPRLTASLLAQLGSQIDLLLADPGCHAIVIQGSDQCFAAGADLNEVGALTGVSALTFARRGQCLFETIARARKPVVAAVAGYCLGGGFDLALACSTRLATPDAVFGHPGVTLGILTGWGGTQRLPHLIGRTRTFELLLRGETVNATQALRLGLVDAVVGPGQLVPAAVARARQLAAIHNPRAV